MRICVVFVLVLRGKKRKRDCVAYYSLSSDVLLVLKIEKCFCLLTMMYVGPFGER